MSRRMRKPESLRLDLSRGDWIEVKKHLTAGEHRGVLAGMIRLGATDAVVDPVKVGISKVIGYLLDWSFEDADGRPLVVREKSPIEIESILNDIEPEAFTEVLAAVERHEAAMEQERKNDVTSSSAISASVA